MKDLFKRLIKGKSKEKGQTSIDQNNDRHYRPLVDRSPSMSNSENSSSNGDRKEVESKNDDDNSLYRITKNKKRKNARKKTQAVAPNRTPVANQPQLAMSSTASVAQKVQSQLANLSESDQNLRRAYEAEILKMRVMLKSGEYRPWYDSLEVMDVAQWEPLKVFVLYNMLENSRNSTQPRGSERDGNSLEEERKKKLESMEKRVEPLVEWLLGGNRQLPSPVKEHHWEYRGFWKWNNSSPIRGDQFQEWGPKVRPLPLNYDRMKIVEHINVLDTNKKAMDRFEKLRSEGKKVLLILGENHREEEAKMAHLIAGRMGLSPKEREVSVRVKEAIRKEVKKAREKRDKDWRMSMGEKDSDVKTEIEDGSEGGLDTAVFMYDVGTEEQLWLDDGDQEESNWRGIKSALNLDSIVLQLISKLRTGEIDPLREAIKQEANGGSETKNELDNGIPAGDGRVALVLLGQMLMYEDQRAIADADLYDVAASIERVIMEYQRRGVNFQERDDSALGVMPMVENVSDQLGMDHVETGTLEWSEYFKDPNTKYAPSHAKLQEEDLWHEQGLMEVQRNFDIAGQLVDRMDMYPETQTMVFFTGYDHVRADDEDNDVIFKAQLSVRNLLGDVSADGRARGVPRPVVNPVVQMRYNRRMDPDAKVESEDGNREVIILPRKVGRDTVKALFKMMLQEETKLSVG